jgi:hypothetical protein
MSLISLVAEAASDILRQIGDGTLKIDGIVLRDAKGKIRYILRGFENLPNDSLRLADHPSLQPLRAVLQLQPILQLVMIAQNAATAASLHRIDDRLSDIDLRIRKMGANLNLLALLKLNVSPKSSATSWGPLRMRLRLPQPFWWRVNSLGMLPTCSRRPRLPLRTCGSASLLAMMIPSLC